MRIIEGPHHVTHIFGRVDARQGPALVFQPGWMGGGCDALFLLELATGLHSSAGKDGKTVLFKRFVFAGSSYTLVYRQDRRVECFSINEGSSISRPIGLSSTGPRVSMLHFYRPLSERSWKQLQLDEDVKLPIAKLQLVAA